jgi:hypothetical protein
LLEFSCCTTFSDISSHSKWEEKKKLEQVQKLNDQLETLTKEKSVSEGLRNVALANEKITANDLKWYSDIREELKDFQIPVDDQLLC